MGFGIKDGHFSLRFQIGRTSGLAGNSNQKMGFARYSRNIINQHALVENDDRGVRVVP